MARYKNIDTSPRFIAVDLQKQLLPGTFEHALDLSRFDARFRNDLTGAAAYPPAMLLKIILFAYSQGIVNSRDICNQQGLIGREMFAIDGVKLPSNASKARNNTRANFKRQADKMEAAARTMLQRHREADQRAVEPDLHAREMQRIDSPEGRARYGRRFATVEPVFGNIRYNKGLDRFTLRGRQKVDAQWKLFCLVHNIEKLAHYGNAM